MAPPTVADRRLRTFFRLAQGLVVALLSAAALVSPAAGRSTAEDEAAAGAPQRADAIAPQTATPADDRTDRRSPEVGWLSLDPVPTISPAPGPSAADLWARTIAPSATLPATDTVSPAVHGSD